MDFETTMNPYEHYEQTAQKFRDTVSKKKMMEETFHPSMTKDYNNVKTEMVKTALELMRLGVQKRLDENTVYLVIDDEEFKISRAEMMKSMDKKQWDDMFPSDNIQTIKAEIDDGNGESEGEEEKFSNDFNRFGQGAELQNPLAAFMTALYAPFMSGGNGQFDMNKMALSLQNAFQPQMELSDEVGSIQKKILRLEKQRDNAIETSNRYLEQLSAIKNENDELKQMYDEEVKVVEDKNNTLSEELKSIKEAENAAKSELDKLRRSSEDARKALEEKLSRKQKELEKAQEDGNRRVKEERTKLEGELNKKLEDAKREAENLKKTMEENAKKASGELAASVQKAREDAQEEAKKARAKFEEEISALKKQLQEADDKAKNAENDLKKKYEEQLKLKDEKISELEDKAKELDEKTAALNEAQDEVEAGKKRQGELLKKINQQEQEIKSLEELAYSDKKIGVLNNNAFNRDFPAVDKDSVCLAITGVRNMKVINEKFGRAAGDQMLKVAAEECIKEFGADNVYKVFNDEFAIIAQDEFNNLVTRLTGIKDVLAAQDRNVVYGIAIGSKCQDKKKMVNDAEGAMLTMKNSPMGVAPIPQEMPQLNKKAEEEPEDVDMSDMLEEYMTSGN